MAAPARTGHRFATLEQVEEHRAAMLRLYDVFDVAKLPDVLPAMQVLTHKKHKKVLANIAGGTGRKLVVRTPLYLTTPKSAAGRHNMYVSKLLDFVKMLHRSTKSCSPAEEALVTHGHSLLLLTKDGERFMIPKEKKSALLLEVCDAV
jgi:hypothetical protein